MRRAGLATIACLSLIVMATGPALSKSKSDDHAKPGKPSKDVTASCKKMSGTIAVRIQGLRQAPLSPPTIIARGAQTVAQPIFGGTKYGTDPDGQRAADLQLIKDYNQRLVAMNCPSFDLDALLAPGAKESPRPTIPAQGKAASKPKT